jgi:nucleoside 2-deoxyribosyltransferase
LILCCINVRLEIEFSYKKHTSKVNDMKIVICGSMKLSKKMIEVRDRLEELGHGVFLPRHAEEYAEMGSSDHIHNESAKNKIKDDLIRDYYNKIAENDAVLIINDDLNGVKGYIGGNSFLEMGFAHVLNKKIYLYNNIPESSFKDEIVAMQPVVLDGDISKI